MNQNHNISDQELDALFKEAAGASGTPAFDDSYWNEMEAMLPKKKRKGILFWITSAAASIVVVFGLLFFLLPAKPKTTPAELAKNNKASVTDHSTTKKQVIAQNADKSSDDEAIDQSAHAGQSDAQIGNDGYGAPAITDPQNRKDKKRPAFPENTDPLKDLPVGQANNGMPDNGVIDHSDKTVKPENKSMEEIADLGKQPMLFTTPVTLNDVLDHTSAKRIPYYMEFAVGYGQSYKRVDFGNNWMSQFRFGGGLYTTIGQMQLSAGMAFRAEVPNNISRSTYSTAYSSQNIPVDVKNETAMRGLYSVEFPLFIGGTWNRSVLGASMTPGIQLAYTGFTTRYENAQVVSRDKQSGSIPDSKTMTMEIGLRYGYSITERVQLSTSCNVDVIRPFQSTYYNGDNRNYPVSFFLGLRRTF